MDYYKIRMEGRRCTSRNYERRSSANFEDDDFAQEGIKVNYALDSGLDFKLDCKLDFTLPTEKKKNLDGGGLEEVAF